MICVFEKGAKRVVIASQKASSWKIPPGDQYFPNESFKSEAAFIKRWKALEKNRYTMVKFTSGPPKTKPRKKYTAKVTKVGSFALPPLVAKFAGWLKGQLYGDVGYFELATSKIPARLTDNAALKANAISWLHLPDGSEITIDGDGAITFLDSEGGKPKVLAKDLRAFLGLLAKGKTKITDLDDKAATGRKQLAAWLAATS